MIGKTSRLWSAVGVAGLFVCVVAVFTVRAESPVTTQPSPFVALDMNRLHNAYRLKDKLISGAQPDGEDSFKYLSELGVKTIISVDGATPDVETAKKYGMRYVHIPIGYNGVGREAGLSLAKALDELPGPIYVHCHHGKHRSAAAVAVACVYSGALKPEQAESVLKTFGTGANYKGLWKDARDARPVDPQLLSDLKVDYHETSPITDTASHMVEVDTHWDHLKQIQKAKWQAPADHPDLDPAHEALQLEEHLREVTRLDAFRKTAPDYQAQMTAAADDAASLSQALRVQPLQRELVESLAGKLAASCTSCHKAYRD